MRLAKAFANARTKLEKFQNDHRGEIAGGAISLVFVVVGVIVTVLVIAALAGTYFDALADLGDNFTTVELGTSDAANIAETIVETLAILVLIAGAFVLVGFALRAFNKRSG